MYIYKINKKKENKMLHTVSEEVCFPLSEKDLAEANEVLNTALSESQSCLGVSAIQCGINKRYFWLMIDKKYKLFINPEVVWHSKMMQPTKESCLSTNITDNVNMFYMLHRYRYIMIKWYDEKGKAHCRLFCSKYTRRLLHELDHLNGRLITDKGLFVSTKNY